MFAARSSLEEVLPAELAAIVPWDARQSAARVIELLQDSEARVGTWARSRLPRAIPVERDGAATVAVYREATIAPVPEARQLSRDELSRDGDARAGRRTGKATCAARGRTRHARGMYELQHRGGSGLALIGPHGAMPEDLQRGLLALSANARISRPIFAALAALFRLARGIRPGRRDRSRSADPTDYKRLRGQACGGAPPGPRVPVYR